MTSHLTDWPRYENANSEKWTLRVQFYSKNISYHQRLFCQIQSEIIYEYPSVTHDPIRCCITTDDYIWSGDFLTSRSDRLSAMVNAMELGISNQPNTSGGRTESETWSNAHRIGGSDRADRGAYRIGWIRLLMAMMVHCIQLNAYPIYEHTTPTTLNCGLTGFWNYGQTCQPANKLYNKFLTTGTTGDHCNMR